MVDEMQVLDDNGMWDLEPLPTGKKAISCRWVFAVKFNPDGFVARLKAPLVAKGYAQGATFGVCCSRGNSESVSSLEIFIWFKTESPCLV